MEAGPLSEEHGLNYDISENVLNFKCALHYYKS